MIKREGFNYFPNKNSNLPKQRNNLPKQFNNYPKQNINPTKSSKGLPKSTKKLLIAVIAIIVIIVLFFIIRGIINGNKDETLVDKLDADLIISEVQVLNYTDISFKVDGNMSKGNVDSINLIIYNENDSVILRKKILINDLEENDFYINIHVTNTSKIKDITVTPTFVNEEGKKVVGEVEDEYTLTDEEKYIEDEISEEEIPEEEKPICTLDSECNDNNACTKDNCVEGECSHTDVVNCIPCKSSSECEDSITCTTNICSEGKCSYLSIPGCISCVSALDCDDSNSCTENICSGGRCLYTPMESCVSCSLDSECEDNDICTENICSNGACSFIAISGCKSCSSNFQCNDSYFSTKDSCLNGKCNYTKITSCINNDNYCPSGCNVTNDNNCPASFSCGNGIREGDEKCDLSAFGGATCAGALGTGYTGTLKCTKICTFNTSLCAPPCTCSNDNNICTADGCVNNVCQHVPLTGNSCTNDNNPCTNDVCSSKGVCTHNAIPGCCLSNAQCTGGKICDSNNVCVDSSISTPTCGDGKCDGTETCSTCSKDCGTCATYKRTFYVNATTGNDNNVGTSPSAPWKTLSKVNSQSFIAGDAILFRRGDSWRGQLILSSGSSSGVVTYGAYGSGNKPLILGSKQENSLSDWVSVGSNLWRNTDPAFTNSNGGVGSLIFNNEESVGIKVYSINNVNSQGKFYYDLSNQYLTMYSTSNPASYYNNIECGLGIDGITLWDSQDYITIENLDIRYWSAHGISAGGGNSNITIRNCNFQYIGGGDFDGASYGNAIQFWASNSNILIEKNTFYQIYDAAITPQYSGSSAVTVNNFIARNNVIRKAYYNFEFFETTSASSTVDGVYFQNNVCLDAGNSWSDSQRILDTNNGCDVMIWEASESVTYKNLFIRNNIFDTSTERAIHIASKAIPYWTFDYNLYNVNSIAYTGSTYNTLTQWRSAYNKDAHSISSNPQFVSSSDFHLLSSSPAIDKGIDVGLPYFGSAPDIGAYEYGSSIPTCTSASYTPALNTFCGSKSVVDNCGKTITKTGTLTCPGTCNSDGQCKISLTSSPEYPLKIGPNNRYLVDQNNVPVFIKGDSPWFIIVRLTNEEVSEYMEDRAAKGFNSIIVDLIEDAGYSITAPENVYGEYPFTGMINGEEDFTTPNPAYFNRAKWVIEEANRHGIQVFLFPAYLGGTDDDGWKTEINVNGASRCRTYGRYIGDLFKDSPNIIWMMGGDTAPGVYKENMLEIMYGIKERDTTYDHLVTLHGGGDSRDLVEGESWLDINSVYSYYPGGWTSVGPGQTYYECKKEYDKSPTMVTYLFESFYEKANEVTGKSTRFQSYWAMLSCIGGEIYGSFMFPFDQNWKNYLNSEGAIGQEYLHKLIDSREWWKLVPDQGVLSSGQSSGNSYVTAARASDGGTVMVYIPDGHAITINMNKVGGSAKCWWYNPRTGSNTYIGEYSNSGTKTFTPPDGNDWLLVIDNAAKNFSAPGQV